MSDKLEAPFERVERYIVIKRKHLDEITECAIRTGLNGYRVNTVECVVVESDWPEYETVWRMIEDRVTGRDGGHRAAMLRAFEASGWSSLLAEKQADIALSVLRTPTPEQAGEVERQEAVSDAVHSALWRADTENVRLRAALAAVRDDLHNENRLNTESIADTIWHGPIETTVDFIDAALQSTPPAAELNKSATDPANSTQGLATPTADAVERARIALREIANMGYEGAPDIRMRHIARDALTALQPTMAGDYVMVPREVVTEATVLIEVFQQNFCQPHFDTWTKCREVLDAFASSPTGGE